MNKKLNNKQMIITLFNTFTENNWIFLIASLIAWGIWFNSAIAEPISMSGVLQYNPNSKIIMHSGSGNINIGISLEQYKQDLKRQKTEINQILKSDSTENRQWLEKALKAIQTKLQDSQTSYKNHVTDLRQRITRLEGLRDQMPDNKLLEQAKTALAQGHSQQADQLFKEIEEQAKPMVLISAEVAYQRCKIAQDTQYYLKALQHCKKAVQHAPKNTLYLNQAALISKILGNYQKAISYLQNALNSDLKSFEESHPNVARDRNNL